LIGLVEAIEHVRQVFLRNTGAGIGHGEFYRSALTPSAESNRTAGRRVAQRIRGEILHGLLEPMRIADQTDVLFVRRDLDGDALLLRRLRVALRDALENLVDVDVLERQ